MRTTASSFAALVPDRVFRRGPVCSAKDRAGPGPQDKSPIDAALDTCLEQKPDHRRHGPMSGSSLYGLGRGA